MKGAVIFVILAFAWACPAMLPGQKEASGTNQPRAPVATIDINQASARDFERLPGIGPKLAQQIVAYRQKHGPFRRVEDLMALRGIGLKKWKAIRPYITVGKLSK